MPYLYQCPYCKTDWHVKSDSLISYGSPLKACSKCQKIYIDPHCEEPALTPYRPYSKLRLFSGNLFSAIGLSVIITVIAIFATNSERITGITFGISFPICWLLLFLRSLRNREKIERIRRERWNDSDKRLRQPQYATLLANLDYKVPSHYLPFDFKYVSEKENYKSAKVSGFHIG